MDAKLTTTLRQAVVLDIARLARDKYIFPEKGLETAQFIEAQLETGRYNEICEPREFADRLTADLRRASADQHWSVLYDSTLTSALYMGEEEVSEDEMTQLKESVRRANSFTAALNWYLNSMVRFSLNYSRTTFAQPLFLGTSPEGYSYYRDTENVWVTRFQLEF